SPGREGKYHLHGLAHARPDTRRPRHDQRPGPALELAIEDQERHAAEVVTVQVGQDHRVDRLRLDAEAPHRDQRRGAAIEKHLARARLEVDAGLEAAAAAERVARSEEADLHEDLIPALMISCRS